mmetsp:Transcript_18079/g.30857  ORF Transcript_18079/g.30857 Transcript_18079/m.30857 type:complete len:124 (+) Transcript_18079:1066-1437(+)
MMANAQQYPNQGMQMQMGAQTGLNPNGGMMYNNQAAFAQQQMGGGGYNQFPPQQQMNNGGFGFGNGNFNQQQQSYDPFGGMGGGAQNFAANNGFGQAQFQGGYNQQTQYQNSMNSANNGFGSF